MSLNVGELVAYLKLDDSDYNRKADAGEKRFSRLGAFLGTAAKTVGAAGAGALVAAGGVGLKTAANMEQASIGFTTMLGSGRKAQAFLADLNRFAAATPFDLPGLQTAASSLISAGIDAKNVIPIMTSLGNATSGMGTGAEGVQRATIALQQMNAAQKISAEDLNQLRDAGIPVYDLLATATGKSKQQVVALAQSGKLGRKELEQLMSALENGKGLERFNGLMQKQSQSLAGLWSTAKDTFSVGMAQAIQPLIPLLKDGLGGATSLLTRNLPRLQHALQGVVNAADAFHQGWIGNAEGDTGTAMLDRAARAGSRLWHVLNAGRSAIHDLTAGWTKAGAGVAYFGNNTQRYGALAHEWLWKIKDAARDLFPRNAGGGVDFHATLLKVQTTASHLWPYLVQVGQSVSNLHPVVTVAGAVFGFLADHIDTVVKYMPLLITAFAAYKAAQAAASVAELAHIPVLALQTASNFALASSMRALATALGYERVGMLSRIGTFVASTAATIANGAAIAGLTVASWALTAVTKAITAGQWLFNAALTANPIGLVVVAIGALVAGLVLAYKHSETFRNIVQGAFHAVAAAVGWVGEKLGSLLGALSHIPGFGWARAAADKLVGLKDALTGASGGTDQLKASDDRLQTAQQAVNDETRKAIDAFSILQGTALGAERSNQSLAAAYDDVTTSTKQNGTSLDINTAKGRANRAALLNVATALNDKVTADFKANESTKGLGAAMDTASAQVAANRRRLIDVAVQAGLNRTAAQRLTDEILKTPAQTRTEITTPGMQKAQGDLAALQGQMDGLHGKNVQISVRATAIGALLSSGGAANAKIDRFASGGLVRGPGGPRDDLIYNAVPAGEFVVNARDTSRARPVLEAINAGHYANGGLVLDTRSDVAHITRGLPRWYDQVVGAVTAEGQRRAKATAAVSSAFGGGPNVGSGVQRWAGLVMQVLGELGLSAGLVPRALRQIQTESGGNPNATQGNIGDVNNRTGDLARGLMQVIGATFRAYAGPYAGLGQYNPHASIYAGLNYARHRYGSDLSFLGQGHGYADGGLVWGPGGPRDDRILNAVSAGEFVVNAHSTARNRSALEAINSGRPAQVRMHREDLMDLAHLISGRPVVLALDGEQLAAHQQHGMRSAMAAAGL